MDLADSRITSNHQSVILVSLRLGLNPSVVHRADYSRKAHRACDNDTHGRRIQ